MFVRLKLLRIQVFRNLFRSGRKLWSISHENYFFVSPVVYTVIEIKYEKNQIRKDNLMLGTWK